MGYCMMTPRVWGLLPLRLLGPFFFPSPRNVPTHMPAAVVGSYCLHLASPWPVEAVKCLINAVLNNPDRQRFFTAGGGCGMHHALSVRRELSQYPGTLVCTSESL